jgi:hypothetical protein
MHSSGTQNAPLNSPMDMSSAALLYRGITGRWPNLLNGYVQRDSTRMAEPGSVKTVKG